MKKNKEISLEITLKKENEKELEEIGRYIFGVSDEKLERMKNFIEDAQFWANFYEKSV